MVGKVALGQVYLPVFPCGFHPTNPLHSISVTFAIYIYIYIFLWCCGPTRAIMSSFLRFIVNKKRRTTVGRTPLDGWSTRRRDLYLRIHNTHSGQISMPSAGFEPTISIGERAQTYTLDCAATETGNLRYTRIIRLPDSSFKYSAPRFLLTEFGFCCS